MAVEAQTRTLSLDVTPTAGAFIETAATGVMPDGRQVDEVSLLGPRGEGKALHASSLVLTPSGWVKIRDLAVGDPVFSLDGSRTKVTGVYPQGVQPMVRLRFTGGSIFCTPDHLWAVQTKTDRDSRKGRRRIVTTAELLTRLRSGEWARGGRWSLPNVEPAQIPTSTVPLDPYLVGVILGDGCLSPKSEILVSCKDLERLALIRAALPPDIRLKHNKNGDYALTRWVGRGGAKRRANPVLTAVRGLGLAGHLARTKFVPGCYLFNSSAVRLATLQGLMDTDGTVIKHAGTAVFSSMSRHLTDAVTFLAESLGGVVREQRKASCFQVSISLPNGVPPFRLPRKAKYVRVKTTYPARRFVLGYEEAPDAEAVCISVEHPSGIFLTEHCIPTHNSWSVLIATIRHAQLHEQHGYPLPVPWFWFRDSFPNQERNLLEDLKRPEWQGFWRIHDAGHLVLGKMGGRQVIKAFVFGLEDQDAVERLRGGCVGIYGEEPAPAVGLGLGMGWTEAAWSLALSSQRHASHYRPALIASNYPDKGHWSWKRFVSERQTQCGAFRIPGGERATPEYRARLSRSLASQPAMLKRLFVGEPAPPQLGDPVVVGYQEPVNLRYTPLIVAPGPLFIGLDFWHHPACVVASLSSLGQLRIHYAKRRDSADVGILVEEDLKPWLTSKGLLSRQRIYTGDPTGDDGDQSDKSQTAVRRLLQLLPGQWRPATNAIDKLQGAVNDQLRRRLSTGEPVILVGPDAQELDAAWSGGWYLNEHGKPVQHGENGQHSHVGMAGAYLVFAVFGGAAQLLDVDKWANQTAYVQPWAGQPEGERGISPAAEALAGRFPGFNREAWARQYR